MSKAFRWYAWGYKVEKVDSKDPLAQWEVSDSSIKNLFKDVLDKTKGFKYQITVKVLLRKDKQIREQNLFLVILILQLKQWLISNMTLTNLFKTFCAKLRIGLMKDLVEQLSL